MNIVYQERIAQIDGESAAYAPAIRRSAPCLANLRRIVMVAADHDLREAAARLEADLADHFAGLQWYLCPRKRWMRGRCRPSARYRAKLTWRESLTMLRIHGALVRKVSVYAYRSLADAVCDAALVSSRKGYSGIVGTDLPSNLAAQAARDCYVRPSTIAESIASGQVAFFAMLMADRRGIDLYWQHRAEAMTASARVLAGVPQSV